MGDTLKKIRLIRKTSKTFLGISALLMLVSTVALYFYLRNLLQSEVEEELRSTEARIESSLIENPEPFQLSPVVEIQKVSRLGNEVLKDTIIYDPSQDEMEEFRELSTFSAINGENYRITVRALVVESENILIAVVISYLVIILLVFLFLFYVNRSRNQKLWTPFFHNLEQMKRFSLSSDAPIALMDSEILEFSELNSEIKILTNKVRSDYRNLKQYTEDVSHEMQTPLAIIQAKIENVINMEEPLDDQQFEQLTSIQRDIQRLSQMTKRLTLLTKIENNQFANIEQLETQIQGVVISSIIEREQVVNIRLVFPGTNTNSVSDIQQMTLQLPSGDIVPLQKVAKIEIGKGVAEINRENQKSIGVVTARLNNRDLGSTLTDIRNNLSTKISLPPGYHIEYGGEYQQQQQAFKELMLILIAAVLLVFTVILFLFRKIKIALAIIFIAILGVAGCLLSLLLTGTPLNVGSYTGIIMIVGIIGENAIFTYQQYQECDVSLSHPQKIEYSIAQRLRPKLMTATAAIMALIPLALGIGAGAQLHQPLAIAVIGGLVFALPLLLVVLPIILKLLKE